MIKDIEGVIKKITDEIKANADVAIIGLSGGADSTLVAILCLDALGYDNVYGIHMPYCTYDKENFNSKSKKLARALDINDMEINIALIADDINCAISQAFQWKNLNKINLGNCRARARMCVLYGVAHELAATRCKGKWVRVIGTGNLSEDYIGYDTKGGDALADIFPIGQLFKSEVYQLLDYYKDRGIITEDLIDRVPSAGLWEGQTDEGEIGYKYKDMEEPIKYFMSGFFNPQREVTEIEKFVAKRHQANKHKHEAPKVIELRLPDLVD